MPGAHDAFIAAHWKQSVGSLAHCLAGDATGIILAAVLTYRFGFPNGIDLILEYTAAFLFGWMVFQALFMKAMLGGNYVVALRGTFFAEFVSMNMVMVGMIPTMVILMHAMPESRNPLHPLFWGVMPGMAMPDMTASNAPPHHAGSLSVAAQAGAVVLTLLALAVAVWLTTRVAPIRL
jgi:hypothetical protein